MKQSLSVITLLFSTFYSLAQQPKVTADTFSFSQKFSSKKIILRSDSTYCLREAGCISSFLTMGFWTKKKDTFLLSGLHNTIVSTKTETLANESPDDSLITFQVQDCYGNPIPKYYIDFFTKDLMFDTAFTTDNRTDDKGILKLRRNSFVFYTTETDQANQQDNYDNIIYRSILQNARTITICLSFPKKIEECLGDNFYKYRSRQFLINNKQLLDIQTNNKYVMK